MIKEQLGPVLCTLESKVEYGYHNISVLLLGPFTADIGANSVSINAVCIQINRTKQESGSIEPVLNCYSLNINPLSLTTFSHPPRDFLYQHLATNTIYTRDQVDKWVVY